MADRRLVAAVLILTLIGLVAVLLTQTSLVYRIHPPSPDSYERVTVTAADANGTRLATVEVRVADTRAKRYLGLSATEDLPMDEGMLFVHDRVKTHTYVMRGMSFPLDIVFVGPDERVTAVHHAPVPDGDPERSYSGRAKWVLEVPRGWANRTGLDVGDRVAVPPTARSPAG